MSAAIVRRVVLAVCVVGIAGMIVTNIAGDNGGSMTFGLVTAVAILCSIVATAVAAQPAALPRDDTTGEVDELGARIEDRVVHLVAGGASEDDVRALVADAVRLGRVTS